MAKDSLEVFLIISLIIAIVFTFLVISFWPTQCNAGSSIREGFSTSDSQLTACPFGSKQMYTEKGDSVCCNGQVNGTQCEGKILCTFSSPTSTLKTCKVVVDEYMNTKGAKFCPRDLPNYFEARNGYPAGCTNGRLLPDRTAVADASAEKCDVFQSDADTVIPSSCKNRIPKDFVPVQNNRLSTIDVKQDYSISFTINQYGKIPQWGNVFHFTKTNTDGGIPGSRMPAVWYWPNETALHIIIGDERDWNWGLSITDPLPMNQANKIMITCKGSSVTIIVNGKQYRLTQPTRRPEGRAILYGSNPWTPAAKARISDFSYMPL